jgi:hypothetical protein
MYDRIVGRMFNEAKRKHEQSFAESGKAINEKVRLYVRVGHASIDARQKGLDPNAAIEAVVAWDRFTQSVDEAERLAEPESFDHLHLLTESYGQVRRYAPPRAKWSQFLRNALFWAWKQPFLKSEQPRW